MKNILFLFLIFISFHTFSQEKAFTGDPDKSFKIARELAFNNQRAQAQDSLLLILTKYPDYHDIRNLLGSTYTWDGLYKKARKEFEYILTKDKNRKDTWIAIINNETWSENPLKAIYLSDEALQYFPNDEDILLKKTKAQENNRNLQEALETITEILKLNPSNQQAIFYQNTLNTSLSKNTVGVKAAYDFYSDTFDPMHYYSLKYSRKTKYGSVIGRVNLNRRFNENGVQFEIDLYPKITEGLYAYLNYGKANSFLFPDNRYGVELYKSLPKSFEISLGLRALNYGDNTTTIYTGSIGLYKGNYYFYIRPYITPNDLGTSTSGTFNIRKYRSDAENYISFSLGLGYSPEIDRFKLTDNEDVIIDLKSQKANFGYNFSSKNKQNLFGSTFGITHQEKSFDIGSYFWIYSISLSWDVKFK